MHRRAEIGPEPQCYGDRRQRDDGAAADAQRNAALHQMA